MKYSNLTKNIPNFFGSSEYDRLEYLREKTNWFENLDKKKNSLCSYLERVEFIFK